MFPHFAPTDNHEDSRPASHGMQRLLDAVMLGAVLAFAWQACGARHRRRRSASSARALAAVHTWEGEGGRPLPVDHAASGVETRPR